MHINDAAMEDVRYLKTIETKVCSVNRMKLKRSEQGRFFASSHTQPQQPGYSPPREVKTKGCRHRS